MLGDSSALRRRQQGVTLLIALIVLVIMTLAGISLMRSVDTTNIIAGNLAFQQAATHAGDTGIETAIGWLESNNGNLEQGTNGYSPIYTPGGEPPNVASWDVWWGNLSSSQIVTLPTDAAGNTVSYTINRMCNSTGPSNTGGCIAPPATAGGSTTSSQTSGYIALQYTAQVYYRITSRIDGPRGTKSYVQAIVAM